MTRADDTRAGRVYLLRDPRDHRPRYVGKTIKTAEHRLSGHIGYAKMSNSHCAHWIKRLELLGLTPTVEVLEEVPVGPGLLNAAEVRWIAHFKELGFDMCNQTCGGDGGTTFGGRQHTQEAKDKVAAANRKEANPERARKISESKKRQWQDPEYRAKMIEAGQRGTQVSADKARGKPGRKHTEESRAKIKVARANQIITPETGRKISEALRGTGKTHPPGWADKVRATRAAKRAQREGGDDQCPNQ